MLFKSSQRSTLNFIWTVRYSFCIIMYCSQFWVKTKPLTCWYESSQFISEDTFWIFWPTNIWGKTRPVQKNKTTKQQKPKPNKNKQRKRDKDRVPKSESSPKISQEIVWATIGHLVEDFTPKTPHSTRSVDIFTVRDIQWKLNPQPLAVLVPYWIHWAEQTLTNLPQPNT